MPSKYIPKSTTKELSKKYSISISITQQLPLGSLEDELDSVVIDQNADIMFQEWEGSEESGDPFVIGKIEIKLLQLGAIEKAQLDLFEVCDANSHEMMLMYESVLSPLEEDLSEEFPGDIIYVQMMYLKPEYRGAGIGLFALDRLIRAQCNVEGATVVLQALTGSEDTPKNEVDRQAAVRKLEKYYQKYGFSVCGDKQDCGKFFGLKIDESYPGIRKVVPHLFRW